MEFKKFARAMIAAAAISAGSMASAQLFSNTGDWSKAFTLPSFTDSLSGLSGLADTDLLANTDVLGGFTKLMFNPLMMEMMLKPATLAMDPKLFTQWAKIALNPTVITSVLKVADPKMIEPMMSALMQPKLWEAMTNFATPEMMEAFVKITMNPEWMTAMTKFAGPDMWETWMKLAFSPEMIKAALKFMEPEQIANYMQMLANPAFMDSMLKMMDPELMTSMMSAMMQMSMAAPEALGALGK